MLNQIRWRFTTSFIVALLIERALFSAFVILVLRRVPLSWDVLYGGIQVFIGLTNFDIKYGRVVLAIATIGVFAPWLRGNMSRAVCVYLLTALLPWGVFFRLSDKLNSLLIGEQILQKPIVYHVASLFIVGYLWAKRMTKPGIFSKESNTSIST